MSSWRRIKGNKNLNVSYLIRNSISAISLDIFDTLLLRNTKSQIHRFYEISVLHSGLFRKHGYFIGTDDLFTARIAAHKIGYRTAPLVEFHRDASIEHIFHIYLKFLGISPEPSLIAELINTEIEYEKENLKLNKSLFDFVLSCYRHEMKVYLITDMYFRSTHLEKLLSHFIGCEEVLFAGIYASCEFSAAKSSGILFHIFLERENIDPESVLHIGDNLISDNIKCVEFGIKSLYKPRSFLYRVVNYLNKLIAGHKYRRYLS